MSNNQNRNFLAQLSYAVFLFISFGWLFHIGSSLLIPLVFSIMFAIFLFPLESKLRKRIRFKSLSIILSFLALIIPILVITTLFSIQFMSILESLPSIDQSLESGLNKFLKQVENWFPIIDSEKIMNTEAQNLQGPLSFIGTGLISTTSFLTSLGMTIIYTFLLLFYRKNINRFILYQFEKKTRPDIKQALNDIKETIQAYISGVGVVVLILSVLNSIGLSLIGVKYALFWGTLGGVLAIIPYIGTLIGGLLPFLFALSTADANWQPIAIIFYYGIIQILEGNLITPKIVGDKVDINPLFAILSIVFFGTFWGVAGVILALPLISILKIILANFEETESYATLLSTDLGEQT